MDASLLCKSFFGLGAAVSLGGTLLPSFRKHIMNYGARNKPPNSPVSKRTEGLTEEALKLLGSIQVPHTWFTHYYVISVLSSLFWATQIYTRGYAYRLLAAHANPGTSSMTANQLCLAWLSMFAQGSRRLYESVSLTKPSQSRMWVGLWAIGMGYYVFMGVAIWVEGTDIINEDAPLHTLLEFSCPSLKTSVALSLFILSSGIQNKCHVHLASLEKYTFPQHHLFRSVVCPHYTSECMIYLAIAIISAPQGQMLNKTVLAGLGFVCANLAVTADSTRKWYVEKFGIEKVDCRYRMIPYIY